MPRKPGPTVGDRARRLLALLPHLRRGRTFQLAALAETLGADPSQLAADLMTLSMCGLPPYTADVQVELVIDDGLVRVLSDPPALTEPARLSPTEARALLAAIEACGIPTDAALAAKLAALAQPGFAADDLRRALVASAASANTDVQGVVSSAVENGDVLEIEYVGGSGEASCRTIRPFALSTHRGAWYVSAFCERSAEDRLFRLDRIRAARPTGDYFDPPADASPLPMPFELPELPVAEIRFAESTPGLTDREWPGATFALEPGGSLLARVPYANAEWIARRVAAHLGKAEVLGPSEVRDAVGAVVARITQELTDAGLG